MGTSIYRRRIATAVSVAGEFASEAVYPDGLTEAAIDALLEEVDRELAADEFAAEAAYRFDFNDQRRVSRARRRADREALRALPTGIQVRPFKGEAA
ncbi:hypothetical protein DMA12_47455 [Amycolatopsis balhimycina DSM 5908]|uniref:Uncharacterized protein n=1 Tax=Amycolatopsis balhimycina DSM 5908 TaxID=1081091 RepID=A0A428VV49_AMYBA|nr:hypothetical protein [Amycolatopsis balhimycina]RSM34658.1 hypothetical protein DMA12_47455 [Amycolatopsis balhimycina DSM 5908]